MKPNSERKRTKNAVYLLLFATQVAGALAFVWQESSRANVYSVPDMPPISQICPLPGPFLAKENPRA
jgi:hypothetical protein